MIIYLLFFSALFGCITMQLTAIGILCYSRTVNFITLKCNALKQYDKKDKRKFEKEG